jgi:hypothetical protein
MDELTNVLQVARRWHLEESLRGYFVYLTKSFIDIILSYCKWTVRIKHMDDRLDTLHR